MSALIATSEHSTPGYRWGWIASLTRLLEWARAARPGRSRRRGGARTWRAPLRRFSYRRPVPIAPRERDLLGAKPETFDARAATLGPMDYDTQVPRFDVAAVVRAALRHPGRQGTWRFRLSPWREWRSASVSYDPVAEELLVDDAILLDLERVPTYLHGRRVLGARLAVCPRLCGRRGRVLWLDVIADELDLACRRCAGVAYASAATGDPVERARLRERRLRERLMSASPLRRGKRHRRLEERARAAKEDLRSLRASRREQLRAR